MFRGGSSLTEAETKAVEVEAARIATLGSEWSPTKEALCEVVLAAKIAGNDEHLIRQREGIEAARAKGVVLGRPAKEKPANFDRLVASIEKGELSRKAVAKTLDMSTETLRRWIQEEKQKQED